MTISSRSFLFLSPLFTAQSNSATFRRENTPQLHPVPTIALFLPRRDFALCTPDPASDRPHAARLFPDSAKNSPLLRFTRKIKLLPTRLSHANTTIPHPRLTAFTSWMSTRFLPGPSPQVRLFTPPPGPRQNNFLGVPDTPTGMKH